MALLTSSDAGSSSSKNVVQANLLSEDEVNNRFLRTESRTADDEERGLTKAFRSAQVKLKSKTLKSDPKLKEEYEIFKIWYKKGYTPEDMWNGLQLGTLYRQFYNEWGGIAKLKANPDYQRYLLYDKFYKIVTNQMPKD